MRTNLLIALHNLITNPDNRLSEQYRSINRVNTMGDALEYYVKDIFCGTLRENNLSKKDKIYSSFFSYLGNQNNPPDAIIKNGDAIEVKKFQGMRGGTIALNSSYPKDLLYANSPMVTEECRNCEKWSKKDLLYIVGGIKSDKICSLWFVYGNCYAANGSVYTKISKIIESGIKATPGIVFGNTIELARVNKVDPLGITDFRVRGMWQIEHPARVFDYVVPKQKKIDFNVNVIMLKEKYDSFPQADRKAIEKSISPSFTMSDVEIKSPNNPAKFIKAKLLRYAK